MVCLFGISPYFLRSKPFYTNFPEKREKNSCNFSFWLLKISKSATGKSIDKIVIGGGVVCRIIKSAKKRVLVNKTKAAQNKAAKSALKTDIKKFEAAVVEGNRSEAEGAYKVAVKAVDKAVVHGLLHRNNAAHKKSAMTIKLNKLA